MNVKQFKLLLANKAICKHFFYKKQYNHTSCLSKVEQKTNCIKLILNYWKWEKKSNQWYKIEPLNIID